MGIRAAIRGDVGGDEGRDAARHVAEATNVTMDSLQAGPVAGLPSDRSKTIVTICAVGKQSLYAMLLLKAQGYERVKSVKGGMQDWTRARHPLRVR